MTIDNSKWQDAMAINDGKKQWQQAMAMAMTISSIEIYCHQIKDCNLAKSTTGGVGIIITIVMTTKE